MRWGLIINECEVDPSGGFWVPAFFLYYVMRHLMGMPPVSIWAILKKLNQFCRNSFFVVSGDI